MDRQTGKSRGFGYVLFTTSEAAKKAVEEMNDTELDGRTINVNFATPRAPNPAGRAKQFGDNASEPSNVLFVGNVSFQASEDMLWEVFSEYGDVASVRLPTDRDTGNPKGFAYVEFSTIETAKKALEGAAGTEIGGRYIRLDYSQPKDAAGGGNRGRGGRGFGDRGGRGGGWGGGGRGGRGGFGDRGGRGGFSDRGGRGGFGDRGGRGRGRGGGDRGGRGGRGGGNARTGAAATFQGRKLTFD
jgi:nucleolin